MNKIPLSLNPDPDPDRESDPDSDSNGGPDTDSFPPPQMSERKPIMGWAAVGFGILGILTNGTVFVPLGFLCSVLALFTGQMA